MASQTGSIDLTASNDAAKTATNYATDITGGGVMVHPSDDATSGVKITSDVDIMRSGTSVINIGTNDAVRIGIEGSGYVLVDSSGMTVHNSDGIPCLVVSSSGGMEALYKKFLIDGTRVYARTSPATEMYQVNFGTSYEFASGAILKIVLRGYAGGDIFNYTCRFEVGTSSTVNLQNALNKANYQVYYNGAHFAYLRRTSSAENDNHTDYYYQVSYAETTVNVHAPSIAMDGSVSGHAPYSSSFGEGLLVSSDHQTVLGRYNVEDANDSNALIIGNGLFDDSIGELVRSNALAVGWDGNIMAQAMAGIVQMFAGITPPIGWLECDGSAVSRETYATLFAVIGTTWGVGDGSTTFNLPDLRGRAPIGAGTGSGLSARTLGNKVGTENAVIPYHTHAIPNHVHTMSHTHPTVSSGRVIGYNYGSITTGVTATRVTAVTTGNHYVPQVANEGVDFSGFANTGASSAANTGNPTSLPNVVYAGTSGNVTGANMQPSAVVKFIICTGKTN